MNNTVNQSARGKAGPTERRRQLIVWSIMGSAVLLGAVMGFLGFDTNTTVLSRDNPISPLWVAGLLALTMWASVFYWRQIDEAARAAHEKAFLWGGSVGMLVALWGMLCASTLDRLWPLNGAMQRWAEAVSWEVVLAGGVGFTLLSILTGYGAAWVLFWWRAR